MCNVPVPARFQYSFVVRVRVTELVELVRLCIPFKAAGWRYSFNHSAAVAIVATSSAKQAQNVEKSELCHSGWDLAQILVNDPLEYEVQSRMLKQVIFVHFAPILTRLGTPQDLKTLKNGPFWDQKDSKTHISKSEIHSGVRMVCLGCREPR